MRSQARPSSTKHCGTWRNQAILIPRVIGSYYDDRCEAISRTEWLNFSKRGGEGAGVHRLSQLLVVKETNKQNEKQIEGSFSSVVCLFMVFLSINCVITLFASNQSQHTQKALRTKQDSMKNCASGAQAREKSHISLDPDSTNKYQSRTTSHLRDSSERDVSPARSTRLPKACNAAAVTFPMGGKSGA